MKAIFVKEMRTYWGTLQGYFFAAAFLFVGGVAFLYTVLGKGQVDLSGWFSAMSISLIPLIPFLTGRMFVIEKRRGTLDTMFASPVAIHSCILGKFLAAVFTYLIPLAITLIFPIIIAFFGRLPLLQVLTAYAGLALLGATFISVGMLVSMRSRTLIGAIAVTALIFFGLWFVEYVLLNAVGQEVQEVAENFSLYGSMEYFNRGILKLSPCLQMVSVTFFMLVLTGGSLERSRRDGR